MKRLFIITCILCLAGVVNAENWHKSDQKQIAWDAPTTYYEGTPLIEDIQGWTFTIYSKDVNGANINIELQTNDEIATVTIPEGGKKYIGVAASYLDVDGIWSDDSEIAWSDNPIDCENGVTFGIHNLRRPGKPNNLRLP